ncbi:glycosyltransferase family 2 protein [Cupriavidus pinatubonensis]|uniref:glycosyltransferase family 2 protein n=1 Tax=Cupriavidus pinatubonensis TaxID=248026 RepID=UPI0024694B25|nr:glycosyltransferase family 2 protein [Cupriavidus pinatubonensis]
MKRTCGVALCTCNGAAYLRAQLDSLIEQSRPPDAISVSDDHSDDGTWAMLETWADDVRGRLGIRVLLHRNEIRVGVTRNFEIAINALDTDFIFLADQDDVWLGNKIEVLAACLEANSEVMLAHSDAHLVDSNNVDLGKSLYHSLYLTPVDNELVRQGRFFEVYCRRNLVTGTTTAFRRELLRVASPFPACYWLHDEWLAACAAAWKEVRMLPDKLTRYRQHGSNVVGVPKSKAGRVAKYVKRVLDTPRDNYLVIKAGRLDFLRRRLEQTGLASGGALTLLAEAEGHFARRKNFSKCMLPRMASIYREYRSGGYARFADGVAGVVRDVIHL